MDCKLNLVAKFFGLFLAIVLNCPLVSGQEIATGDYLVGIVDAVRRNEQECKIQSSLKGVYLYYDPFQNISQIILEENNNAESLGFLKFSEEKQMRILQSNKLPFHVKDTLKIIDTTRTFQRVDFLYNQTYLQVFNSFPEKSGIENAVTRLILIKVLAQKEELSLAFRVNNVLGYLVISYSTIAQKVSPKRIYMTGPPSME